MSNTDDVKNSPRDEGRGAWVPVAGAIAGALLLMACIGVFMVAVPAAQRRALDQLGDSGIANPAKLSSNIDVVLNLSALGVGAGVAGVVTLIVSVVMMKRAEEKGE